MKNADSKIIAEQLEFVQSLGAKFCHDLAGTIGAISSGIEFLETDDPNIKKKAIELLQISSHQATSRLQFFRQTYGISKSHAEANLGEIERLSQAFLAEDKINFTLQAPQALAPENSISINMGKLILSLIAIAQQNLIYGGDIRLTIQSIGARAVIVISAMGNNIKDLAEKYAIIQGLMPDLEISTTNVHSLYANMLRMALGVQIIVETSADKVDYIIEYQ